MTPNPRKMVGPNRGFTFLAVMAMVMIVGISLSVTAYQWKTISKREKEKELLFRGNAIRSAIAQYVSGDPLRRYPHSLDNLVKDPRTPQPVRYLRKLYKDPVNNEEWDLIMDGASGGIIGVRSKSKDKPLKTANFKGLDRCFEGKTEYREWLFVVNPLLLTARGITTPILPVLGSTDPSGLGTDRSTDRKLLPGLGVRQGISPFPVIPCPPTPPSETRNE
jgi:type II secretory pathway pseudopilin PulG